MQTVSDGARKGSIRTGILIVQAEGIKGLYRGVSVADVCCPNEAKLT